MQHGLHALIYAKTVIVSVFKEALINSWQLRRTDGSVMPCLNRVENSFLSIPTISCVLSNRTWQVAHLPIPPHSPKPSGYSLSLISAINERYSFLYVLIRCSSPSDIILILISSCLFIITSKSRTHLSIHLFPDPGVIPANELLIQQASSQLTLFQYEGIKSALQNEYDRLLYQQGYSVGFR